MKPTIQLTSEIKSTKDIKKFLNENTEDLYEPKLREHLQKLLKEKKLMRANVIRKSYISENYAYQIFSGLKSPSRDKIIMLSFGFRLDIEETKRLMKIANVGELYPRNTRDAIIIYAIENNFSIDDLNELLEELSMYILE